MSANYETRYQKDRWPEYWLTIPKTVVLQCPNPKCGHYHDVDVEVDTEQGAAVARIDTDFCEGCGTLFCQKCPRVKDEHGLDWCEECAKAENILSPSAEAQTSILHDPACLLTDHTTGRCSMCCADAEG